MKNYSAAIIVVASFMLAACGPTAPVATEAPTSTLTVTNTPTPTPTVTHTLTATNTPPPTATQTRQPTNTATLTETPYPTPTLVATRIATEDGVLLTNLGEYEAETVVWAPDGKTIYVGSQNGLDVFDGETLLEFGHTGDEVRIRSIAVSPNSESMVVGLDYRAIAIFDTLEGELVNEIDLNPFWVQSVNYVDDGNLYVVGVEDSNLEILRVKNQATLAPVFTVTNYLDGASVFARDGKLFATSNQDFEITIWDVNTGKLVRTLAGHNIIIQAMAFSPDGKMLVTGSNDNLVKLWDVNSGQLLYQLAGHPHWVTAVAFHPQGKYVASAGIDETIILWDVVTGEPIKEFNLGITWVKSLQFSPDGKTLASADADGNVWLWEVP